jgi:8-oxo-dGTP pyrophosphatase MutT (NUDIX family)
VTAPPIEIVHLNGVDARLEPVPWPFAEEEAEAIAANWAKVSAGKPQMFNGTVLMQHRWAIRDGVYEAGYAPCSYASFVAWPALGKPGAPRRNGFAMAALRAADGAFLLGVMSRQTFNAGKIYFPGGTPDMGDVTADGRVDLATSLVRELTEETGLAIHEVEITPQWTLVADGHRAAFLKPARIALPAPEARALILSRLRHTDGELADIAVVRAPADIDEAVTPDFAQAYMRAILAQEAATR